MEANVPEMQLSLTRRLSTTSKEIRNDNQDPKNSISHSGWQALFRASDMQNTDQGLVFQSRLPFGNTP